MFEKKYNSFILISKLPLSNGTFKSNVLLPIFFSFIPSKLQTHSKGILLYHIFNIILEMPPFKVNLIAALLNRIF